jgi:hypothetical protein
VKAEGSEAAPGGDGGPIVGISGVEDCLDFLHCGGDMMMGGCVDSTCLLAYYPSAYYWQLYSALSILIVDFVHSLPELVLSPSPMFPDFQPPSIPPQAPSNPTL